MSKATTIKQIIPAEPGFSAGMFLDDGLDLETAQPSDVDEWFEPVIAWAITAEFNEDGEPVAPQSVLPIGVKGDMTGPLHIRLPDGRIKLHFDGCPVPADKAKELFLLEKRAGVR